MAIKGVILDFNGTMFFDSAYHEEAWSAMSKELRGSALSHEELRDHMHGKNNEKVIEYILGKAIDAEENKRYSLKKEAMYRELCRAHRESFHLAKGVEQFLDTLVEKKIPFTIASASIKENIEFFVEGFHLDRWFDPASIVYDDGSYPTKVEMFQEGAKRIQVPIEDCLVIEDSVSGIKFANACHVAGVIAIDSTHDRSKYEQFSDLICILEDFSSFPWTVFEE